MLRYYYVIIVSLPLILYYVLKIRLIMRHPKDYSEEYRYQIARDMVRHTMHNAHVKTQSFGLENLPKEGGYIMYANHQGKFDALGIIQAHDAPCSIVMDQKRSKMILTNEFIDILGGIRLDKENLREQIKSMRNMALEVQNGRRFILFPEGGYDHNGNHLQPFLPGAFKAALWSKQPIIPVAVIDSYKVFDFNSLKRVTTKVCFLKPMYYEEYKDLNTREIADCVKARIQEAMEQCHASFGTQ